MKTARLQAGIAAFMAFLVRLILGDLVRQQPGSAFDSRLLWLAQVDGVPQEVQLLNGPPHQFLLA